MKERRKMERDRSRKEAEIEERGGRRKIETGKIERRDRRKSGERRERKKGREKRGYLFFCTKSTSRSKLTRCLGVASGQELSCPLIDVHICFQVSELEK